MPKCNLIAAKFSRKIIQMTSPHTGAQITRRFFNMVNRIKNIRFKNRNRHMQNFRIVLNHLAVCLAVAGVHNKKFYIKFKLAETFQVLKAFRHQHRIFSAGNADRNFISRFYQFILRNRFRKLRPDIFPEFFMKTPLHFFRLVNSSILFFHLTKTCQKPRSVTALKAHGIEPFFTKFFRNTYTGLASAAANNKFFCLIYLRTCRNFIFI